MKRSTHPRVRLMDSVSRVVISIGGIGIIAAVLAIMVYLAVNAMPLFSRGRVLEVKPFAVAGLTARASGAGGQAGLMGARLAVDEYRGQGVLVEADGSWRWFMLDGTGGGAGGSLVPAGLTVTAISEINDTGKLALGLSDGSVSVVEVGFTTDFLERADAPEGVTKLLPGQRLVLGGGGYVQVTPRLQFRRTRPSVVALAPVALPEGSGAVVRVDFRSSAAAQYLVAMRADASLFFNTVRVTTPLGGGKPRTRLESQRVGYEVPLGERGLSPVPDYLFATGDGTGVLTLWSDGTLHRYFRATGGEFVLAERTVVRPLAHGADGGDGVRITRARMHLGGKTLITGSSDGTVLGSFAARANTVQTPDGYRWATAHEMSTGTGRAVSALGVSARDRSFVVGDEGGNLRVWNMTSQKLVVSRDDFAGPVGLAVIAPKYDGVVALSGGDASRGAASGELLEIDPGHPEVSLRALFGKVWYEGDTAPQYTYQSSSAEETAETKYSNTPLIFGTIKSTLYAMLFAVPIALLAAIYTSEFLHPRVRNTVKPVIEMMASLPSVVLGFLAALVIAPLFRDHLAAVLMAFFVVPVTVLLAAYLWQMVPIQFRTRLTSLQHAGVVALLVLLSVPVSLQAGGVMERALFRPTDDEVLVLARSFEVLPRESWPEGLRDQRAIGAEALRPYRAAGLAYADGSVVRAKGSLSDPGVGEVVAQSGLDRADMRLWLDGVIGTALPGWLLVLTAPGLIVASLLRARVVDALVYARFPATRAGPAAAPAELLKFCVTLVSGLGLAGLGALLLTWVGLDARDFVLGSFTQRNTLVVGVVMGFAIIPIIYTISEDALSAVPAQLRSASLGCGATRWQTATRVVLPIAMSGVFSAAMIGLGRAAGETMIVLMSTGNTPDMDWNLFSGFRTLSANIAVEMPEAPRDSTHYRVLFLGALCLFALTAVVNTVAEVVRARVRRRIASL